MYCVSETWESVEKPGAVEMRLAERGLDRSIGYISKRRSNRTQNEHQVRALPRPHVDNNEEAAYQERTGLDGNEGNRSSVHDRTNSQGGASSNDAPVSSTPPPTVGHKSRGRHGGGLGILFRKDLGEVQRMVTDKEPENILWASISDTKWRRDKLIGVVYMDHPAAKRNNNKKVKDIMENIASTINKHGQSMDIIIGGDFNMEIGIRESSPHTSESNLMHEIEGKDESALLEYLCNEDSKSYPRPFASDPALPWSTNTRAKMKRGSQIMDHMDAMGMVVLNGRSNESSGDTFFSFAKGQSTIDFVFVQEHLAMNSAMTISDLTCGSDHVLLEVLISDLAPAAEEEKAPSPYAPQPHRPTESLGRFKINDNNDKNFWKPFEEETKKNFPISQAPDRRVPEQAWSDLKEGLRASCEASFKKSLPPGNPNASRKFFNRKLKDKALEDLRRRKRKIERELIKKRKARDLNTKDLRDRQKLLQKSIRDQVRKLEEKERIQVLHELKKLGMTNKHAYWKLKFKKGHWKAQAKQSLPSAMRDDDGVLHKGEEKVLQVGKDHFQKISGDNINDNRYDPAFASTIRATVEESLQSPAAPSSTPSLDREISLDEVEAALSNLKRNKAAGLDGIKNEILKYGSVNLKKEIQRSLNCIWKHETIPQEWNTSLLKLIYKGKGDKQSFHNYRGIALQSNVCKILTSIMNTRITDWLEDHNILADEQAGFRRNRSCLDQIFILNEVITYAWERNRKVHAAFLDVSKAYDTTDRASLLVKLREYGINGKMWRMIAALYKQTEISLEMGGARSQVFEILQGVKQGCNLSPTLYSIFLNALSADLNRVKRGVKINRSETINHLLYADDLVLLAESEEDLRTLLNTVNKYAHMWRFSLNTDKSKVVIFEKKASALNPNVMTYEKGDLEIVPGYKYLGVYMAANKKDRWEKHKKDLLRKAQRLYYATWKFGCEKGRLSVQSGILTFEALIRPILEYACEIWGEGKWPEAEALQKQMYRRIAGVGVSCPILILKGDLGMSDLGYRRDMLRIRFNLRCSRMSDERICKKVWCFRARTYMKHVNYGLPLPVSLKANWSRESFRLIRNLEEGDDATIQIMIYNDFDQGDRMEYSEASNLISKRTEQKKQRDLSLSVARDRASSLSLYRSLKAHWDGRIESYLRDSVDWRGTRNILLLRAERHKELEVVAGRYKGITRDLRTCECCGGAVGDVPHFLDSCPAFDSQRRAFIDEIEKLGCFHLPTDWWTIIDSGGVDLHRIVLRSDKMSTGRWLIPVREVNEKLWVLCKRFVSSLLSLKRAWGAQSLLHG